jgi:ubiquinone/menaquinone biosynthesis C-methylase UbiE
MSGRDAVRGVSDHYGRADLLEAIIAGLRDAGVDHDALPPDDLAGVDQFHIGGKAATLDLARRAGLQGTARVLDVGGGIGGTARTLAAEYGCAVTVLDLTEEYCRVGERLTELTRQSDRVAFRHGSAVAMPFADASFDVAWTQHSSMNIAEKERLYAEVYRVLRPGGTLVLHEVLAGPRQPVHFPVPWATEPSISFLRPPDEIRAIIGRLGFTEREWTDTSQEARAWFRAGRAPTRRPIGLHLLLGATYSQTRENQLRNLDEGRIVVIEGVFRR